MHGGATPQLQRLATWVLSSLQEDINRYRDEVNSIRHHLGNVEKSQKEFSERQKELTNQ
jgi:prefoldin subunit 5